MSVQRRVNWISQQRVDVPDVKAIESAVSNDFDSLIQAFVTGNTQGYILRGFEILMSGAIGGAASGLQMLVDPGAIFHPSSSQSGTSYLVPTGMPAQQLNSATNSIVDGAFAPSAINYVGLEYERFIDSSTNAQVYIWDPTANDETTKIAPRAQILRFRLKITTTVWAANVLPVAIVTTDAGNNVISITDARWRLTALARGGASPNPFYQYPWTAQAEGRTPNPSTSSSNSVNPFHGGEKMLGSLKDWMDAVMTSLLEIKGTTYWTSTSSSGSLESLRADLGNTILTGNSNIAHGILPNSVPVLTTTGNINSTNQLTNLASTTGIVDGQVVLGTGIPMGTTVLGIAGNVVTLSHAATATTTGISVSFYTESAVTAPGQVNWASNPVGTGQIYLKLVGSRITYKIAENPTGSSVTLADNQVAYLNLTRGATIVPNLVFTPNSGPDTTTVTSVGAIAWTASLQAGDYVRAASDIDAFYYKIQSVDSLTQVTLVGQYTIVGMTASGVKSVYAFGNYTLPGATGTARDILIANREAVPTGQNIVWLLLRSDDGGSIARVYVKFLGAELQQGSSQAISGPTLTNVLQYIGSPMESASLPGYVSALNPGSLPEITDIKVGAASTVSTSQYFYVDSPGDRKYYFWFRKNGTGTDPAPAADRIGVPVDIVTGQTAIQVAAVLVEAFSETFYYDFAAIQKASPNQNTVRITNTSAGVTVAPVNVNVSSPFLVTTIQSGTGVGNNIVNDGDNLTLAIKKLDSAIGTIIANANNPNYDEALVIAAPVSSGANLALPNNSRVGNILQLYTVGKGNLQVFLNGQYLNLNETPGSYDWTEFGAANTNSNEITINRDLVVGDVVTFRIGSGGAGGAGGGGGVGPTGPVGPSGPPGADAAGGPIAISTKTSSYTVLTTDCFLKANAAGGAITFTLPPAATASGRIFYLKKIDASANSMSIQASGAELIDGSNSLSTNIQYLTITLISDGSTWSIF